MIKNRKHLIFFLFFIFLFFLSAPPVLAQEVEEDRCALGGTVSQAEAGVFMKNICTVCWEQGNCQLEDFMQVFVNVADYILAISGSLALLVFVIGGFMWMISQGDSGRVTKGKDFMKGGLIGLLIIFGAYLAIQSVESILVDGQFANEQALNQSNNKTI